MKITLLLVVVGISIFSGCGKQDRVEFIVTYTPSEPAMVSNEQRITLKRGETLNFPTSYQALGRGYAVRSTVFYSEDGDIRVLAECGVNGEFESEELVLEFDIFKEHDFPSGVTVRAVAHRKSS